MFCQKPENTKLSTEYFTYCPDLQYTNEAWMDCLALRHQNHDNTPVGEEQHRITPKFDQISENIKFSTESFTYFPDVQHTNGSWMNCLALCHQNHYSTPVGEEQHRIIPTFEQIPET